MQYYIRSHPGPQRPTCVWFWIYVTRTLTAGRSMAEERSWRYWRSPVDLECPKCPNSIRRVVGVNWRLTYPLRCPRFLRCRTEYVEGEGRGPLDGRTGPHAHSPPRKSKRCESVTAAVGDLDKWLFCFDWFDNDRDSPKLDQALCKTTDEERAEV